MAVDYTTEFEPIFPRKVFADPKCRDLLQTAGIAFDSVGNAVMLFRDPRTAAALLAADETLRQARIDPDYGLKPWEDTDADTGKADFVIGKLHEISDAVAGGALTTPKGIRLALLQVHMFAKQVTNGQKRDREGYPMVASQALAAAIREPATEAFDAVAAVGAATAQVKAAEKAQEKPRGPGFFSRFLN